MRRVSVGLCVLAAALLGSAACADAGTKPGVAPTGSAVWVTYQAAVSAVTPGPGAKTVTVHVKAPAGGDSCSRNVRVGNRVEENGVVFADIVQDSAGSAVHGACPTYRPAQVRLTSPQPIGDRPLTLNQKTWALRNGTYVRCDENLGCTPPKDRCDPIWTRAAVQGMDVSRHSQGDVEACDGTWLVMTVPDDATTCGAEARPGCEVNTSVRRYFLRSGPAGWTTVTRTASGGCADALKAAPTFPRKLCAGLSPTSRFVSSAPALPSDAPPGG